MTTPLVSIVIPTAGRPDYLPRSIASALEGMGDDVEVIVVPNGIDESWRTTMDRFRSDKRVKCVPIMKAHANAARNHGLTLARGKYVRFLDDDDFFYRGAVSHQCSLLEDACADICSGCIDLIAQNGFVFESREVPETSDFVESVLAPAHVSLLTAHVFRRSMICDLRWDETLSVAQDKQWMYQLCERREWLWVRTDSRIGAWQHHAGQRISDVTRKTRFEIWSGLFLHTVKQLSLQNRLSAQRSNAASAFLWRMVCGNYFMNPPYWDKILNEVNHMFPNTVPELFVYKLGLGKLISPRSMLIGTMPLQWTKRTARIMLSDLGLKKYAVPP